MLSNNLKSFQPLIICLLTFLISINISEINTKKDEALHLRSLLEIIPRFRGRAYSNKININYENNKFTCRVAEEITPKEFSFLSTASYSICSDKIYENFESLAKKINQEVEAQLEPKLISNTKFLNDFKQVLYFAYTLAYSTQEAEKKASTTENENSGSFYDKKKMSYTQTEILDNLSGDNFNLLDFSLEDLKIVNNYLHTIMDFNINQIKQKINSILENIEKSFKGNAVYRKWLFGNTEQIKYFIGIIWANAINLGFDTLKHFSTDLKSKLDSTENLNKIENIRNILTYSETPGVLCLFEFLNLCGLPKKISSREEESALIIKKDIADKRIIFYNNKLFPVSENYHYIKNKNWSNLDYLLAYGDIVEDFYNDYHRIYIDLSKLETQQNLAARKEHIDNFITKEIFSKFQQYLQNKSYNNFLTLNLKNGDSENLKKLYRILYPKNQNTQNLAMLNMLYDNLYRNLQMKIDFENKNRLKNHETDFAIVKLIAELKQEIRKLNSDDTALINMRNNRLKVIQYVRNSRNVLLNFSSNLFEDTKKGVLNDIKNIRKTYI